MKNSNKVITTSLHEKSGINQNTQMNSNKLNKTQVPPKPAEIFQNTYYGQRKNTPNEEKASTQLPPRVNSTQKMQYKVSQNMTNSNIQSAKQGLQLLKKKMSRNGMSRQKRTSIQKKQSNRQQQQIPKKTIYKPQNQNEYSNNQERENKRNPPKLTQKRSVQEDNKSPPIPTKANLNNKKSIQNHDEYINQNEEVPIKANQDFMAILERQMAKEKQMGNIPQKEVKKSMKVQENYEENQVVQLVPCNQGCGRKFNPDALDKHQRICRKVFQQKRKVFNAAQFRQPEVQDFKMPPPPPPPQTTLYNKPEKMKKKQPAQQQKKIPKWKLQSAAFRAGLKQGRGEQLTKQEKQTAQKANNMQQCPCCGRKFNEQAANRHIPLCQAKSKQMPKMNMKKK